VRVLVDECLSGYLASQLRDAGHDCVHVYEIGLGGQPDQEREFGRSRQPDPDFGRH
jgi:predicted nuclease of predicted toxin-antitoxin system